MATAAATTKKPVTKKAAPKAAPKKAPVTKSDAFAVIATGGKQYAVSVGDTILIEKFKTEQVKGDIVTFDEVLLSSNGGTATIGAPTISGASVTAEVIVAGRAPKVTVIRYKQKSRYMKKNGHRQPYLKVKITGIK